MHVKLYTSSSSGHSSSNSYAQHFTHKPILHCTACKHSSYLFYYFYAPDMFSPNVDPEVPMDYSTEYDASDKSSIDDSDEACSIPGSFSPDNNHDGSGDQKYEGIPNIQQIETRMTYMMLTEQLRSALLFQCLHPSNEGGAVGQADNTSIQYSYQRRMDGSLQR